MDIYQLLILSPWIFVWIVLFFGMLLAIVQIFKRPIVGITLAVALIGLFAVSLARVISTIVIEYGTLATLTHLGLSFFEALFLAVFVVAIAIGRGGRQ